ncbi:MAG: response regulator transcription factor [Ktedonobacteraceae bacterium]
MCYNAGEYSKGVQSMFEESQTPVQAEEQPTLTVLVIDDDENIIDLIKLGLKYEGFQVESTSTGSGGLAAAQRLNPALVVLDLLLPDVDGLEVCNRLRSNPTTRDIPILMLTAKDDVRDRVAGLETGADDYLAKPFDFDELVARIRAILRRARRGKGEDEQANEQVLTFGDLLLNTATHEVTRAGRQIDLTSTEYNLLYLFMSHPRQVLDRQTILNRVWGYDFMGETNIIEVYVRYLREKIEETPSAPRLIQTIRGSGYILKG